MAMLVITRLGNHQKKTERRINRVIDLVGNWKHGNLPTWQFVIEEHANHFCEIAIFFLGHPQCGTYYGDPRNQCGRIEWMNHGKRWDNRGVLTRSHGADVNKHIIM